MTYYAPQRKIGRTYLAEFWNYDSTGALANPSGLSTTVTAPDGTETHPTPATPSTGYRTMQFNLNQRGLWHWQFDATDGGEDGYVEAL